MYRNQVPKNSNISKEQKQNNNKNQNTHDSRKRQREEKNGGGRKQLKTQHTQIYSLKRMEFFYIAVFLHHKNHAEVFTRRCRSLSF